MKMPEHDPIAEIFAELFRPQTLKELTEERALRLENGGRLPASYYGWSDDDPAEEARREDELKERGDAEA